MSNLLVMLKKIDKIMISTIVCLKFAAKDDHPLLKRFLFIWLVIILIATLLNLFGLINNWKNVKGNEYYWIAESIEKGHGFSYAFCLRCVPIDNTSNIANQRNEKYYKTAHEEPVYPYLLGITFKVLGEYGHLVILVFQVLALFFTSIIVYFLARKIFDAPTGMLAGIAIALMPSANNLVFSFNPVTFAGLLIAITTHLIFWCNNKKTILSGIILGLTLGLTSLLYAPTLLFIPISILFILTSKNVGSSYTLKTVIAVFASAIMVLSVWTTRNYIVFGQIIPVKTGFGFAVHESNIPLAKWANLESCSGLRCKVMKAREAIIYYLNDKNKRDMYRVSDKIIQLDAPKGYELFNEAERNSLYLKRTIEFVLSHPIDFLSLTLNRVHRFFFMGKITSLISLLFFISAIILFKRKDVRLLLLLILAYGIPYFFAVTWWYRYRYPIEPLFIVLACYLPVFIFSKFYSLCKSSEQ